MIKLQKILATMIGTMAVIDVIAIILQGKKITKFAEGTKNEKIKRAIYLGLLGGLFGIYATIAGYQMATGVNITVRDVGPMFAGCLGGPLAGLIAGAIAGLFRLYTGISAGITAGTTIPCSISTIFIGGLCGLIYEKFKDKKHRGRYAIVIGICMEALHLVVVFFYKWIMAGLPITLVLMKDITLPFLLSNALAFALVIFTTDMVDEYLKIETTKDKINAELKTATNIQKDLLPKILPDFPGRCEFDVYAKMDPAKEVGGDFYDLYFIDDDHFVFTVADVSGKGVPAALFMVIAKTILKNNLQLGMSFEEAIEKSNFQLAEGNDEDMFVTAWIGVLEISTGKLSFMNCGHNPPVVLKQDQHAVYLTNRSGFVLAGMKKSKYKSHIVQLGTGDKIFVYTDGVTEATNKDNELYGEDRLLRLLNEDRDLSPEDVIKEVKNDIDLFVGEAEQFDDITMFALRYNGAKNIIKTEEFPATIDAIEDLTIFIEKVLTQRNASPKAISELNIVIDELFGNIAKYAYTFEGGKVLVSVEIDQDPLKAIVTFEDGGKQFNPLDREDPDTNLSADERDIGGLGILVVKKMVSDISYKYEDGKNILTIVKEI